MRQPAHFQKIAAPSVKRKGRASAEDTKSAPRVEGRTSCASDRGMGHQILTRSPSGRKCLSLVPTENAW